MHAFKHHIDDSQRYNIYESYTEIIDEPNSYLSLRNTLIYITLLLFTIVAITFSFKFYKEYDTVNKKTFVKTYIHQKIPATAQDEYTHLQLTKAISKSIVHNLQSQRVLQNINDAELKCIIKSVVNKIEKEPRKLIYTKN